MPFEAGTRLGPYEILAALPTGITGEAYKASDTKLNRTVTLRLIPTDTLDNPAFRQRLERETRAVASLSHPHIGALYEVGRHENTAYLVTEYIEGETLADRLKRGPLELEDALKTAAAIADALDKAHRRGVIHRNLSPSSIVLTADGVKVVEFGVADMTETIGLSDAASMASTRTAPPAAMSAPTRLMPYRSPEQIEGKEPDAKSDIFAFGAILYEMVTGKPAFEGKTQALLIAAITSIDPDPVSKTQPMAPPALDFVVKRCLVKTPQKRLQTASDLYGQLQWITGGGSQGALWTASAARKKREQVLRIALLAVLLLAAGLALPAYLYYQGSPAPPEARFVVSDVGFISPAGGSTPTISPNGRWLLGPRTSDELGAEAVSLDSVTKQLLLSGHATYEPFWKPDSTEFAFWEGGQIKKASASGGPPQNLCDASAPYAGGSWSSQGVIAFSSAGLIYRVLDVGGERVAITRLDVSRQETEHLEPYFLPDGRHFLYLAVSSQPSNNAIYVGSLDSPDRTLLFASESRAVYAAPGYVVFNRGDVLYAHAFDADKLVIKGEPIRIADGVPPLGLIPTSPLSMSLRGTATFDVSQTGVLVYRMGGRGRGGRGNAPAVTSSGTPLSLLWFDRTNRPTPIGPPGTYAGVNLAPDGKRFAVHRHEGDGGDIWLYDPDQGDRMQRWTFNVSQENSMPVWSPDGKRIAFASRRNGKWGIYVKAADNTGNEDLVVEPNLATAPMSWTSTDQLVYWVEDPKTRGDIWVVPMTGERKPAPILRTDADERFPQVSADGKWIAYQAPDAMGAFQIWVNSFPQGQGPGWQVTNEGGQWPRWRKDGKELELYFNQPPNMRAVALRVVGSAIQPGVPQTILSQNNPNLIGSSHYSLGSSYYRYAVTPDGQRFLMTQPPIGDANRGGLPRGSRGTLADQLAAAVDQGRGGPIGTPANEIAVVLDWTRLLKGK